MENSDIEYKKKIKHLEEELSKKESQINSLKQEDDKKRELSFHMHEFPSFDDQHIAKETDDNKDNSFQKEGEDILEELQAKSKSE